MNYLSKGALLAMSKINLRKPELRKPNVRAIKKDMLTLGQYMRSERLRIGIISAEQMVDLIYDWVAIPEGLITGKQIYVLEDASCSQPKLMQLAVFSALADALLNKATPSIQYLYNPKREKAYNSHELGAIGLGWIDPLTGEFYPDLDLDPKIRETFLNY